MEGNESNLEEFTTAYDKAKIQIENTMLNIKLITKLW